MDQYTLSNGLPISPAIYNLRYDETTKEYYLEYHLASFAINDKLFGGIEKKCEYLYRSYKEHNNSTNILMTGVLGSGKTTYAEYLCNVCISKGMPVIRITGTHEANIVDFLDRLANVVVMIDEFGKKFNYEMQNKLIETVSSSHFGKKIFLLIDNDKNTINSFFINRPGRIRYHLDFTRIKKNVIEEYCEYHEVDDEFKNKILDLYNTTTIFTTDHLKALVREHKFAPELTLEEMLEILNITTSTNSTTLVVLSVKKIDTGDVVEYNAATDTMYNEYVYEGRWLYLSDIGIREVGSFNNKQITSIDEDTKTIVAIKGGYEITMRGISSDKLPKPIPKKSESGIDKNTFSHPNITPTF